MDDTGFMEDASPPGHILKEERKEMLPPRRKQERDEKISARLNDDIPMCLSSNRYTRLVGMAREDMGSCGMIYHDLKKRIQEPTPDLNRIKNVAMGVLDTIMALDKMEFVPVLGPGDVTCSSYNQFMELRRELLGKAWTRFREISEGLPLAIDSEFTVQYRDEKKYPLDMWTDYYLIFDRRIPYGKEGIEKVIEGSELSFFLRSVMAEPFCYPLKDGEYNPFLDDSYKIYTMVIVSFWNPIKKEELVELFPDALIEQEYLHEYYNKFFLFESHFRNFVPYND
ncbi:MAG: hypothetical protein LUK37_03645 [Clostridia bacterium]|nr:hypothetical protein [Clostridia bacterium]